jgi:hypothetical protein
VTRDGAMRDALKQMVHSSGQDDAARIPSGRFELRFASLFNPGRGLSFPCNGSGEVDVDAMSDQSRANLKRALSNVGVDYAVPMVIVSGG